jgi:hypothetical protein
MLLVSAITPVAAQDPTIEVLAEGLNAPRGVFVATDGSIYVAEAGVAGEDCIDIGFGDSPGGMCYGPTGSVARIVDGSVERVIEGLTSAGAGPEIGGVSDITLGEDGSLYLVMNLGADPAVRAGMPADFAAAGWLMKATSDGSLEPVADVAAFESDADPDAAWGGHVDSNPYAIEIIEGGVAVADAGGNTLLKVADDGSVSLIAAIPFTTHAFSAEELAAMGPPPEGEAPAEGEPPAEGADGETIHIPVQSVPTSVALGPDGALYVGELTGGPFPVGGASVWRVAEGEEPTQYAAGFSSIMGLAFGPDGTLYVAELAHDGLMGVFLGEAPPIGAVMSVPPGGGEPALLASGEQLMALGGLDVDDAGAIYVSTGTIMGPGAGSLVKITP